MGLLLASDIFSGDVIVMYFGDRGMGISHAEGKWKGFTSYGHRTGDMPRQQQIMGLSRCVLFTSHVMSCMMLGTV